MVVEHDERERSDEVVEMDGLHGRPRAADAPRGTPEQQPRREALGAGTEDRRGAQRRDHDAGVVVAPLHELTLDLRGLHARREARVGPER